MKRVRKGWVNSQRWLDRWSVSEDEPGWGSVAVAGLLFFGSLAAIYGCVLLVAAAMDVL